MASDPTRRADAELPRPALKAILLCERTIQEAGTDRITIVGILDRLAAAEFPLEYLRGLKLYVRVTDAAGEYAIRVELVRLEDNQVVGEGDLVTTISDRRTAHAVAFDLPRLALDYPGRYDFRVFANDRFLASEVLLVEESEVGG
jgi:hypothetical protein